VKAVVRIEPWTKDDFPLLQKLLGDPLMTEHLGGPETPEQLAIRQLRFENLAGAGRDRMFKVIDTTTGVAVGSVGYWERKWRGEDVYEVGWSTLPAFQGRGFASTATSLAVAQASQDGHHRFIHAFPSVQNQPSNAICRKVGFTLLEEVEFEYPKGSFMQCNDWRFDLFEIAPAV
jgi:RimJ/RimL family protein N-acetyltransferase